MADIFRGPGVSAMLRLDRKCHRAYVPLPLSLHLSESNYDPSKIISLPVFLLTGYMIIFCKLSLNFVSNTGVLIYSACAE